MMNFTDLETFYEVARRGGFSQAASAMRTAQSAMSRRVARLEHQLGVKLFERHGRGVRLTADGQALMARAEALISELGAIGNDIRGPFRRAHRHDDCRLHAQQRANSRAFCC